MLGAITGGKDIDFKHNLVIINKVNGCEADFA